MVPRKRFFPAENAKTSPPDKVVRTRRHLERRFISHTEDSGWERRRMIYRVNQDECHQISFADCLVFGEIFRFE